MKKKIAKKKAPAKRKAKVKTVEEIIRAVTDVIQIECVKLSKADYVEVLEGVQEDVDSRLAAARSDLKREGDEEEIDDGEETI